MLDWILDAIIAGFEVLTGKARRRRAGAIRVDSFADSARPGIPPAWGMPGRDVCGRPCLPALLTP